MFSSFNLSSFSTLLIPVVLKLVRSLGTIGGDRVETGYGIKALDSSLIVNDCACVYSVLVES